MTAFYLLIAGIVGVVGGLIWWLLASTAKRTRQLQEFAGSVGFTYERGPLTPGQGLFVGTSGLRIFNEGYNRRLSNVVHGRTDDAEVRFCDYSYEYEAGGSGLSLVLDLLSLFLGSRTAGGNRTTRSFSAVLLTSPGGPLFPAMQLYPEGIFSKIGAAWGGQDIDFAEYPQFSKRFVLKSTDEITARAMIDPPTAAFFETHLGVAVEASGQSLLFYRPKRRVKTAEARQFLDTAIHAYRTLAASAARTRR